VTDDDHTDPPKKSDHRVLAIALAFLAAAAFGFSAFSGKWLYASAAQLQLREHETVIRVGPVHEVGFGLRSMFRCVKGTCEDMTNGELVEDWRRRCSRRSSLGSCQAESGNRRGSRREIAAHGAEHPEEPAAGHAAGADRAVAHATVRVRDVRLIAIVAVVIRALLALAAALVLARKRLVCRSCRPPPRCSVSASRPIRLYLSRPNPTTGLRQSESDSSHSESA
jgi:hypothetical protein